MPIDQVLSHGALFAIAIGVMILGVAGIVLPLLPGLPLVWLGALIYGLVDGFRTLDLLTFAFITVLALIGIGADLLGGHIGAKLGGASNLGGALVRLSYQLMLFLGARRSAAGALDSPDR